MLGGLSANYIFGKDALVGYLICGFGDAFGEIIGISIGRHKYRTVISVHSNSYKTIEGSIAVFVFSSIAMFFFFYFVKHSISLELVVTGLFISLIAMIIEAISPRGMDNITMQLLSTWCYTIIIY